MSIQDELPKSRITLTYRTTIRGVPEEVNLPLRLLVLGDFSLGTSKDRKLDLEERKTRAINGKNLSDQIADMGIKLKFEVANRVNPDVEADLPIELDITGIKSFSPDSIVNQVPKLRALLLLKTLLLETQSAVDNRKELRKTIYELFSNPDALKAVMGQLKGYDSLRLPSEGTHPAPAPVAPAPVAPAPPAPPATPAPSVPPA